MRFAKFMVASIMATCAAVSSANAGEPPTSPNPSGRYPIAAFGKQPFMRTPRISPDGTKIAFQLAKDGKSFLALMDLTQPNTAPKFIVASNEVKEIGDRRLILWRWVGNNFVVFTLESREAINGRWVDLRRLVSYNLQTAKLTPLAWDNVTGFASNILHIDHDKSQILLERHTNLYGTERFFQPQVVRVDVATGKVLETVVNANPVVDGWTADSKGIVRAGDGSDGDSGKDRLVYRSDANGAFKTVSNSADSTFTEVSINPVLFLDEPDMALTYGNKDNFSKLYKVNMKTLQLSPPIFEKPGFDANGGLVTNLEGNKLLGISYTAERTEISWIDPDWKIIQQLMDNQFGKGNALMVSHDRKDEKVVFFVSKSSQPGSFYLFDTKTGKLSLLGYYHPILKDKTMNPMRTITYTASDGVKIPAIVTMPRNRMGQKNLPIVVLPHGGPFGVRQEEEFGYFPWHQAVAELGYVVIEPNYRGSGGYGKEFVKMGRKPDGYGKRMQDDLNDALAAMAADGTADPKRACIMGWSYGGYATARGAQRDPDKWRCAIAGAGVYDNPMMTKWDEMNLGRFSKGFQDTSDDPAGISPARNTKTRWSPILIVAGARDQRIPLEQSRTLVSRLKSSGKKQGVDFDYLEQPKNTHNLPYEDVHIEFLEATEKWLRRWNPPYVMTDKDKEPPVIAIAQPTTAASK